MIYLDSAATTRPFEDVIAAMQEALRGGFYNPSAAYAPAFEVERGLDACREALRKEAGARGYDVVFTSGGTESDALALLGTAGNTGRTLRILCGAAEHPAVMESCRRLQAQGHLLEMIPVDGQGIPDLDALEALLQAPADLVTLMQVNNETGAVSPIAGVAALLRRLSPRAVFHMDGVQGFMRLPLDLSSLGVSMLSLSGHKIHGPKGIGALLVQKNLQLAPLLPGGGQEGGRRSGTENTPGVAGLLAAVRGMRERAAMIPEMRSRKVLLWNLLREGFPELLLNGPDPSSDSSAPHILNVSFPGLRGEVLLHALEGEGVLVSTGSACSARRGKVNHVLAAMGRDTAAQEGAIRFSLSLDTTEAMIEEAAALTVKHAKLLQGFRRR